LQSDFSQTITPPNRSLLDTIRLSERTGSKWQFFMGLIIGRACGIEERDGPARRGAASTQQVARSINSPIIQGC
jgi:hypothetical protein